MVRAVLGAELVPRADARPLRHDGAHVGAFGRGLQQHLAANGEPEPADAPLLHVVATGEEGGRAADVVVAAPAPARRLALARAHATWVEEEHAVAVLDEHPGVLLDATSTRVHDHRGAVA